MEIPISLITPSPKPIRTTWAEDKMQELAQSIREKGVISPIKVRPVIEIEPCPIHDWEWLDGWSERYNQTTGYNEFCRHCAYQIDKIEWSDPDPEEGGDFVPTSSLFEIVYGHRRVEAARRAGLETIPAIVEGLEDDEALIQALIENVQREDMSDVDKGRAFAEMNKTLSLRQIQEATGLHYHQVGQLISLVKDEVVAEVFEHGVSDAVYDRTQPLRDAGDKAQAIRAATEDAPELKRAFAEKVVKENLSAPYTKRVAEAVKAAPTPELKRRLIERPYNPVIHNADVVKEVAKYPERPRNQVTGFEWESRPEVAAILAALKQLERRCADIEDSLPEWKRTVDIGKFSPEAVPFFITRLRRASGKLHTTARRLEELGEWIDREQGKLALPE